MQRFTPIFALTLVLTTGTLLAQQNGGGVPGTVPTPEPTVSPTPTESPGAVSALSEINKDLALNYIHHLNNTEIQHGQVGLSRAQSDQLSQYAQALITEHQANEERLQDLAVQEGVDLQGYQGSTYDFALLAQIQQLSSEEFDQIFAQLSAQEHGAAIQELQTFNGLVQDPEVKAYITQKITELQAHQQRATALASGALQPSPSPTPTGTQSPGVAGGEGVDDEDTFDGVVD